MNLERSINVQARLENGRMKLNRTHYSKRPLIYLPVGRTLGGIDELVSQAFRNGFDVAESRLTCTSSEEIDGLIHPTQRGNIDGLTPNNSSRSNTSCIFPWSTVCNRELNKTTPHVTFKIHNFNDRHNLMQCLAGRKENNKGGNIWPRWLYIFLLCLVWGM